MADVWMYGAGQWDGRWLMRGGDEYDRHTLLVRLPGERAVVFAFGRCRCA